MKQLSSMPGSQGGSMYSTLIMVILFGLVLTAGLKIAPAYLDNNVISNAMSTISANNDIAAMNIRDIRADLYKTFTTNGIENFDMNSVVVTKENGKEYIDIDYEARKTLFYNIDAVVSFKNRFDKF